MSKAKDNTLNIDIFFQETKLFQRPIPKQDFVIKFAEENSKFKVPRRRK